MNPDSITGIMWQLRSWCRAWGSVGNMWVTITTLIYKSAKSQQHLTALLTTAKCPSPHHMWLILYKAFPLLSAKRNNIPICLGYTLSIPNNNDWYRADVRVFFHCYTLACCLLFKKQSSTVKQPWKNELVWRSMSGPCWSSRKQSPCLAKLHCATNFIWNVAQETGSSNVFQCRFSKMCN